MWFFWYLILFLIIAFLVYMTIKTKGRYPLHKLILVLWRVLRFKYFLDPQIENIKRGHAKIFITPQTLCYLDALLQFRFKGLDCLDKCDLLMVYKVTLGVPTEKLEELIDIFIFYRENLAKKDDLNFEYYLSDIEKEYLVDRKYCNSFFELNLKMSRFDNYKKYSKYLVADV